MKRGEMFQRIFRLLSDGWMPDEIISLGFPKSTVYWAKKEMEKGKRPVESKLEGPAWMRAYDKMGLLHQCEDGRRGIIVDTEIWTDEGIIFEKRCSGCDTLIEHRFEKWTPESKERYSLYKRKGYTDYSLTALFAKLRGSPMMRKF